MTDLIDPADVADEDEFTELADAAVPRIDLVGKGANGFPFLIAKGQGLLNAEQVADLIGKQADTAPSGNQYHFHFEGNPAEITKAIHEAALRSRNANQNSNRAADGSTKESAMTDDVNKAAPDLDEPLEGAGDAMPMPGSPEWEAIDAATAAKWIGVLGRAKNAVCLLRDRELQEAVVGGDTDSADNAESLSEAECAIDCAISILAPYAVGEQMEAGDEGDDLTLVGKAAADVEAPLALIEALAPVMKAGRVLSGANEVKLRDAVALLQQVLATLPAPVDSGQPVAKEADMAADNQTATPPTPVEAAGDAIAAQKLELGIVHKAKGDPVVVVFNAEGKLIGVVDPDDLLPVSDSGAAKPDADGDADASADAAPADDAAAAAPADDGSADAAAAAPADGSATIPGTDTVQAPAPAAADDDLQKAAGDSTQQALELIKAALSPLAEQAAQAADLASVVKALQDRVEYLAKLPDQRHAPAMNGVGNTGTGNEGTPGDAFADLRKAVEDAPSENEKAVAKQRLAFAEIKNRFQR